MINAKQARKNYESGKDSLFERTLKNILETIERHSHDFTEIDLCNPVVNSDFESLLVEYYMVGGVFQLTPLGESIKNSLITDFGFTVNFEGKTIARFYVSW